MSEEPKEPDRRWYHGRFGTIQRPQAEAPKVELTRDEKAAWRAWQKAEREKEEKK